jgi:aryl-alcohol dehydrogenase-like predicted oxidoreductase
MDTVKLHNIDKQASRIGLGTWAIGGWMWGGTDERESVQAIHYAFDKGINLIDTAPVYGFGRSEEIVGKAIKEYGRREDIILTTKVGLEWNNNKISRNSSRRRIEKELDDSLQRLQTDYLDVYMIHWPDEAVPFQETASVLNELMNKGKIRSIAVSNFDISQMQEFRAHAPLHVLEPPYNMFERDIEKDIMPYCKTHNIRTFTYGALCRGLLSGKMTPDREFTGDDLRKVDPKFKKGRLEKYLKAVRALDRFAQENFSKQVIHLAVRWLLDKGADVALWGARRPDQLDVIDEVTNWQLNETDINAIDKLLDESISEPIGPEFMAPPRNKPV